MFTDPVKNLKAFGLREDMVVADLGAGSGFYTIPLAEMVPRGKVYAIEIQRDFLTTIRNKANDARLSNVECFLGDVEKMGGTKLKDKIVDAVIASNILFQVENKDKFTEEIKRIFDDTLTDTEELLGYTNLENLPKIIPEDYLKQYAKNKIINKIKTRMLSPISRAGLKYLDKYYPKDFDKNLVEILFINPKQFMFEYEINIYNDKVSIVSLNPDELMGLIIKSSIYAKTQRGIFNLAWLGATSFVAK